MDSLKCQICKNKFNESDRIPMTLPCSHPLCSSCLSTFKKTDNLKCPKCGQDFNIKELKPHQIILSFIRNKQLDSSDLDEESEQNDNQSSVQESNEDSSHQTNSNDKDNVSSQQSTLKRQRANIEYCDKHNEKGIEFFCQLCMTTVCSICIFETHNGHHLVLLDDMSIIIKNNVSEFGKIVSSLEKVNNDNLSNVESKLEEVEKQKQNQITIVTKTLGDLKRKIEEKQNAIIEEFNIKYLHEIKRFKKIETCLHNNQTQMERIALINEKLTGEFERYSDARILKKVDDFTLFLHRSAMDIKKLYKTEISLKAELVIDPAMKPIQVNLLNMMELLDKLDPKLLCYPYEDSSREETDVSLQQQHQKNDKGRKSFQEKTYISEKKSFEKDLNNYINRIGTLDHEKTESEINSSNADDNQSKRLKISKHNRRKLLNGVGIPRRSHKSSLKYTNTNNNTNVNKVNDIQQTIHNANQFINNIPNQLNPNGRQKNPSAKHSSKRAISNKLTLPKISNEPDIDLMAIYCFGEGSYCMKLLLANLTWELIPYVDDSKILGSLRYNSICTLPSQSLVMTGGSLTSTGEAVNTVIEINAHNINSIRMMNPLITKRYGHGCIYTHSYIYVFGGYDHQAQKAKAVTYSTLKSCERYDSGLHKWESVCNMNHPRAFFGYGLFMNHIFVFGGIYNDQLLPSIEKYDPMTNIWSSYHIKMPEKLAKMGVINYQKDTIILLGGINEDYDPISSVSLIKLNKNKGWKSLPDMMFSRGVGQSVFLWEDSLYVLGGNEEGICERLSFDTMKWGIIPSYFSVIKSKKISEVIDNFSCIMNFYIMK